MYSKIYNLRIAINGKAVKVIKIVFYLLLNKNQNNMGKVMKHSEFVFDYVHLFYCKCPKINPNRSGSNTNSPEWSKNKKSNNKSYQ